MLLAKFAAILLLDIWASLPASQWTQQAMSYVQARMILLFGYGQRSPGGWLVKKR